ncbi:MAG: hypothetical protein LBR22_05600 [Desulfovibrio sp.]|nr:hypothetical protein [Desulfovibrio sp.]
MYVLNGLAKTCRIIDIIANSYDGMDTVIKHLDGLDDRGLVELSQVLQYISNLDSKAWKEGDGDKLVLRYGPLQRKAIWLENYIDDRFGRLECSAVVVGKIDRSSLEGGLGGSMMFTINTEDGERIDVTEGDSTLIQNDTGLNNLDMSEYNGDISICLSSNENVNFARKMTFLCDVPIVKDKWSTLNSQEIFSKKDPK